MDYDVVDNREKQRFEAHVNGLLGVAQYRIDGHELVLTHTEVPPELRGQGVAEELARTAFDSARARKMRVVPQCRFMNSYLKRHPEYQDLVD